MYPGINTNPIKTIDMNNITTHRINRLFITVIAACLLPVLAVSGQEIRKETLKGNTSGAGKAYAVFYSTGMAASAVWPIGMKLSRNGATIRHTPQKGNGDNISVNDKVPFRFIIAPAGPADGGTRYWAAAMSFNTGTGGDNTNLNPNGGSSISNAGCRAYSTAEFPAGSWRLPTQRELILMWIFRNAINAIYPSALMTGKSYWSATEYDDTNAYSLGEDGIIEVKGKGSVSLYLRCVRDY